LTITKEEKRVRGKGIRGVKGKGARGKGKGKRKNYF
jgi:hypothetical protein